MAFACYCSMGKIMWKTSHAKAVGFACPSHTGFHPAGCLDIDPFTGASTTGIAANLTGKRFLGIDKEREFVELSRNRKQEIEDYSKYLLYRSKIKDLNNPVFKDMEDKVCEDCFLDLPF